MQTQEQTAEKAFKFNVYKIAKIYFINNEKKTFRVKKQRVHGLNKTIKDKTGKEYQLFTQDELQFYADIPINDPNVGIMIDGVFWRITTISRYRNNFEKLKVMLGEHDLSQTTKKANESIIGFEEIGE